MVQTTSNMQQLFKFVVDYRTNILSRYLSLSVINSKVQMVSSGEERDTFASDELQKGQHSDNGNNAFQQIDGTGICTSQKSEEVIPVTPEKSLHDPDVGLHISQLDKEGSVSSITSGKVSKATSISSGALKSGQEGRSPFVREKVSEDGYHWRKYGQKLVKGNEFIRSYYKCTHPSCPVKKQLECSHDGKISDIVYFGQHVHPKPELNLPPTVGLVLSVVEEKADEPSAVAKEEDRTPHQLKSSSTSQISTVTSSEDVKDPLPESNRKRDEVDNDDDLPSKRQKKGNRKIESTPADKHVGEPRVIVQTLSELDIVNDGFRWRKYGQKLVKGNPNPRSYYRCSSPGCPVKKHVERASHDPKVVITSYEGQHDHNMPPSRTITQNAGGLHICATAIHSAESGFQLEGNNKVGRRSSSPSGISKKQLNCASGNESIGGDVSGSDTGSHSGLGLESKSNELLMNHNLSITEGITAPGTDAVINTSSVPVGRSNEQHDGESRTELKVNCTAYSAHTVTPGLESNPNEQHIPNAEPVQS